MVTLRVVVRLIYTQNTTCHWSPQGTVFGLALFNILVNDMDSGIECSLSKFVDDKVKCKVLHLGQSNPKHEYRLSRKWIQSSPEKNLGVLADEKLNMSQTHCSPENQPYPGLHQKQCGQQGKGGDCPPCSALMRLHCTRLWGSQQRKYMEPLEQVQRRATKIIKGL